MKTRLPFPIPVPLVLALVGFLAAASCTPPSDSKPSEPSTVAVTAVSVSPTTLSLVAGGDTGTLTATVTPSNATNKTVTWSSSDTAVATVSATGVVTPVAAGSATITATSGGFSATTTVTVVAATVATTGVSLSPATLSLVAGGATGTLTATVTPANATNKTVTWSSSDTAVATVSGGVVTPVAAGSATVTATAGGLSATTTVTVIGNGSVSVTVQTPAYADQALSFSASSVTATVGQTIEVTPTFVTGATDWRWYVNGVQQATTSSLSYTPTAAGHYAISVTVSYNGVLYSGSVTATVAN